MERREKGGVIESSAELRTLCRRLRRAQRVGLDTEFVGERTYVPRLELVQIASDGETAVIDCQAVEDLDPLLEMVLNPDIEKVLHAGQQDLELLYGIAGQVPAPVFDTQVGAAMVGYGAQPGYAALIERILQTKIEKTQTLTDWSRRPLTATQIAYAHEDVRYLLPLRERLGDKLKQLGREAWAAEELLRLQNPAAYRRPPSEESYLRVRGRGAVSGRGLAILRELAAWREEEARRRNKPRGTILSDDVLVELSRRAPESEDALRAFRGQFARVVERHAGAIIAAVHRALALPRKAWPQPPVSPSAAPPSPGVLELLQATLRLCADAARIAPTLVATTADLHTLVEAHSLGNHADLPLLAGWRRDIAGERLLALLEGEASLHIDAKTQRVRFESRIPATKGRGGKSRADGGESGGGLG